MVCSYVAVSVPLDFSKWVSKSGEGFSFLVGTDTSKIVSKTMEILNLCCKTNERKNPYGDGNASENIINYLKFI